MKYLYRYETKGIQSWILSSNKLRDLAGGSALIESLTEAAAKAAEALGAEILQATSGAMTAIFSDKNSLQGFAAEWPMQVAYRAPGLQLVQAWVGANEGTTALFESLAQQRNEVALTSFETCPWVLRTGHSGRPAVPRPQAIRTVARSTTLDQVALARERARAQVHYANVEVTGGHPWEEFEERLEAWPEGPIAVIHADGSGVGQRLMETRAQDLQRFSSELKAACLAATGAAIEELSRDGGRILARPIVSAGDDLTYIVLARDARHFAQTWLQMMETETERRGRDLGGRKLVGGAGIVMLNRGYPFSAAYSLAEELCTEAKNALKARNQERSVLAFRRITNSLVDDVSSHATAWVQYFATKENLLDQLVGAIRPLPRGTLRTWLEHFQRRGSRERSNCLWARAREVARPSDWERLERALVAVGADPATGAYLKPAAEARAIPLGEATESTPIADALALRTIEKELTHV